MSELDRIKQRDAEAQCVDPRCHQTAADRRTLLVMLKELQEAVRERRSE